MKKKVSKILLSLLLTASSLFAFANPILADDSEIYTNNDQSVVVMVERNVKDQEVTLNLSTNTDKTVKIDDIEIDRTSIKGKDYLYSYAVGENGDYKFTVKFTRTLLLEQENEQSKEIQREETFDFTVKVHEIKDVSEIVEDSPQIEIVPQDTEWNIPVIENAPYLQEGHTIKDVSNTPLGKDAVQALPDNYRVFYIQETAQWVVYEDIHYSYSQSVLQRSTRSVGNVVTTGTMLSSGTSFYWGADPSFNWTDIGFTEIFVNGELAQCLEPTVLNVSSSNATSTNLDSVGLIRVMDGRLSFKLTVTQQRQIVLISNYGTNAWTKQAMVYEAIGWVFTNYGTGGRPDIEATNARIANHTTRPSWHGTTKQVKIGDVVDLSESMLSDFEVVKWDGLDLIEYTGGRLVVRVREKTTNLVLNKKSSIGLGIPFVATDGSSQQVLVARQDDPVSTGILFDVIASSQLRFYKAGENGVPLANTTFKASYDKTVDANGILTSGWTYTTGADGYTAYDEWNTDGRSVYVQEISVENPYIVDTTVRTLSLEAGLNYTESFTNSKARGQIDLVKVDSHGKPLANVEFELKTKAGVSVAKATTDMNGKLSFKNVELGDYTLHELKVPNGIVLDKTAHAVSVKYANQTTPIVIVGKTITNKYQRGSITLTKTEDANDPHFPEYHGISLAGVEIALYAERDTYEGSTLIYRAGELIGKEVTNSIGQVTFHNLPLGDYYAKELKTIDGYILSTATWKISLKYDVNNPSVEIIKVTQTVTNTHKLGSVRLIKTGDNGNQLLQGAEFGLYRAKDNKLVGTGITDKNGQFQWDGLRTGEQLYLQEIKAPWGWITSDQKYPVTVTEQGEVVWVAAVNEQAKVKVRLFKTNSETGEPLADAHFRIFDVNANDFVTIKYQDGNNVVEKTEWVTDETGYFTMEGYLLPSSYKLIETIAPEGFNLADPIDFIVDENTTVIELEVIGKVHDMNVPNRPIRSDIKVAKVDKNTGEYLPNFPMKLTSLKDMSEIVLTTDANGIALFENYLYGRYMVEEIGVDGEYIIDRTPQFIDITEDGIVYEVTFENEKPTGSITFTKSDEDTAHLLDDAVYRVWNDAGTYDKEFTTLSGVFTDSGLELGDYHYQEIKAPHDYIIDTTVYDFSVEYVDMDTPIIYVHLEATNKEFKGEFELTKTDAKTGEALANVGYEFTYPDGTIHEVYTDTNGLIHLTDLNKGTYSYKEVKAVDGYVIDETVYTFEIVYQDQDTPIVSVQHERTNTPNLTVIYKFDKDGNPLIAEFEIYEVLEDGTHEYVMTVRTDKENGGKVEIEQMKPAQYVVKETWVEAPHVINPDNQFQELIITEHEAKYTIKFENEKAVGQIDINKTDAKTNAVIEHVEYAVIDITDRDDMSYEAVKALPTHETLKTNELGQLSFKDLDISRKWAVIELSAPYGYVVDETVQIIDFEYVDADTPVITQTLDLINERQSVTIKGVKVDSVTKSMITSKYFDLQLKDKDGNVVPLDHKDENGIHYWIVDALDMYYMNEEKAPLGYILSDEIIEIDANEVTEDYIYTIYFENETEDIILPPTGLDNTLLNIGLVIVALGLFIVLYTLKNKSIYRVSDAKSVLDQSVKYTHSQNPSFKKNVSVHQGVEDSPQKEQSKYERDYDKKLE